MIGAEPLGDRPIRVLMVEDHDAHHIIAATALKDSGVRKYSISRVTSVQEAMDHLKTESGNIDVVLLDLNLPDSRGIETFVQLQAAHPEVPIVVATGSENEETTREAMRGGAQDYIMKRELTGPLLDRTLQHAIARHALILEQARQISDARADMARLEVSVAGSRARVADAMLGAQSLREANPEAFTQYQRQFDALVQDSLEERVRDMDADIATRCRSLARRLGRIGSNHRDIVFMMRNCVDRLAIDVPDEKATAIMSEARLRAFELMGSVLAYNRDQHIGRTTLPAQAGAPDQAAPRDSIDAGGQ